MSKNKSKTLASRRKIEKLYDEVEQTYKDVCQMIVSLDKQLAELGEE